MQTKKYSSIFSAPAFRYCFSAGLIITILTAMGLYRSDTQRIQREFMHLVDGYASAINEEMAKNIAILRSFKSFFQSSEYVSRQEFNAYTQALLSHYPSMRNVGWIPHVTHAERAEMEMLAKKDGLSEFQITHRQEQGTMVRAAMMEEYYPVYYLEPIEGNQAALGFDLASNEIRKRALHDARDSGEARTTGRILLVQEEEEADAWAELFFFPVYNGDPTNLNERRSMIQGMISGVFRIHDIMTVAGTDRPEGGMVNLALFDQFENEEPLLLHETGLPQDALHPDYEYQTEFDMGGGHSWRLSALPMQAYIVAHRSATPLIALLTGLLSTAFLSHYTARMTREKERIEEQVAVRTQALNIQRDELRASNEELKISISEREQLQQQYASLTDHEQRRLGQELHDSLGQQVAVAAMLTRIVKDEKEKAADPSIRELELLEKSILTAQSQIRALSKGLLPVEIDPSGLSAALSDLVASVNGMEDFSIYFECSDNVIVGDNAIATHLYRIAQEALRNALEHGEVSTVTLRLNQHKHVLTLEIIDDGKGMNPDEINSFGSGLSIMKHRADLIGAELIFDESSGLGTSVICRIIQE